LIVTAVGGLPDLVKNNEYIVPPGNPDLLARKMIDCLSDPTRLKAMAADAQQVATDISWPGIAQQTLTVYKHLLNPKDLK
jgi:glycosyltransferase involved in cell wall biosynthesis